MTHRVRIKLYYAVSFVSLFIAVAGFSYNTWRLELSEHNTTVRTAAFDVFNHLAELEQIIYAAHYDNNTVEGSPRKGWVKVGLIVDLSLLISPQTHQSAEQLKTIWQDSWQTIPHSTQAVNDLTYALDEVKQHIRVTLRTLK